MAIPDAKSTANTTILHSHKDSQTNTSWKTDHIRLRRPDGKKVWKRFIDDIFSLWNVDKEEIYSFIEQANNHHPTVKFTAEVSETEAAFLDTCIYKGERFTKESILDVRTHFKPTETFQSIHVLLFMSPPRGKERIHKRRGLKITQNKLF